MILRCAWRAVVAAVAITIAACNGLALSGAKAAGGLPGTVSVGALLPLTGNAGFIGEELRQGVDIFLEGYDKSRSATGLPKLDFVFVDSQADPRVGVQGYQLLRSRHNVQVIYLTYTSVAISTAPAANKDKVTMLSMSHGEVTKLGPQFFGTLPAYSTQGEIIVKEAMRRGVKKIGIIYENSEAFVVEAKHIAETACPKLGCKVVASEQIPAGSTNVAAQVTAALADAPDAVFPIGIATQLVPVARELRTRNYKGQIIGLSDMGGVVGVGSADLIEGAIYLNFPFNQDDPEMKRLTETYKAKYGKPMPQYVAYGFQTAQIIAATVKTMKQKNLDWSGPNFAEAQKQTVAETIVGQVRFLSDRRIAEPMNLVQVKDGKPVPFRRVSPEELKE